MEGYQRTHAKCEHIRKCTRRIVEDMELTALEQYEPSSNTFTKCLPHAHGINNERPSIESTEYAANDRLPILSLIQPENWPGDPGKHQGSNESPRYSSWEFHVVVLRFEPESNILCGYAVCQDIMGGLDVEGLFHLCEWGGEAMDEDKIWEDENAVVPQLESDHCRS